MLTKEAHKVGLHTMHLDYAVHSQDIPTSTTTYHSTPMPLSNFSLLLHYLHYRAAQVLNSPCLVLPVNMPTLARLYVDYVYLDFNERQLLDSASI